MEWGLVFLVLGLAGASVTLGKYAETVHVSVESNTRTEPSGEKTGVLEEDNTSSGTKVAMRVGAPNPQFPAQPKRLIYLKPYYMARGKRHPRPRLTNRRLLPLQYRKSRPTKGHGHSRKVFQQPINYRRYDYNKPQRPLARRYFRPYAYTDQDHLQQGHTYNGNAKPQESIPAPDRFWKEEWTANTDTNPTTGSPASSHRHPPTGSGSQPLYLPVPERDYKSLHPKASIPASQVKTDSTLIRETSTEISAPGIHPLTATYTRTYTPTVTDEPTPRGSSAQFSIEVAPDGEALNRENNINHSEDVQYHPTSQEKVPPEMGSGSKAETQGGIVRKTVPRQTKAVSPRKYSASPDERSPPLRSGESLSRGNPISKPETTDTSGKSTDGRPGGNAKHTQLNIVPNKSPDRMLGANIEHPKRSYASKTSNKSPDRMLGANIEHPKRSYTSKTSNKSPDRMLGANIEHPKRSYTSKTSNKSPDRMLGANIEHPKRSYTSKTSNKSPDRMLGANIEHPKRSYTSKTSNKSPDRMLGANIEHPKRIYTSKSSNKSPDRMLGANIEHPKRIYTSKSSNKSPDRMLGANIEHPKRIYTSKSSNKSPDRMLGANIEHPKRIYTSKSSNKSPDRMLGANIEHPKRIYTSKSSNKSPDRMLGANIEHPKRIYTSKSSNKSPDRMLGANIEHPKRSYASKTSNKSPDRMLGANIEHPKRSYTSKTSNKSPDRMFDSNSEHPKEGIIPEETSTHLSDVAHDGPEVELVDPTVDEEYERYTHGYSRSAPRGKMAS